MQYRLAFITLLLFGMIGGARLQAQFIFDVTWDSLNVPSPSVVNANDTLRYDFAVTNTTNSPFLDTLIMKIRTPQGVFTLATYDSMFIQAFGTEFFSIPDTAYAVRYGGGVNVVVIWPTSPSPIVTDSLIETLTVITTSIDPAFEHGLPIDVFPVPGQQEVFFRLRDNQLSIRRSEIQNMAGQVIRTYVGLPRQISVADLAPGIYFMRIEDESGRMAMLKMVKQ